MSPVPGTTTDPVRKAVELPGLGPCVLIDTAGIDDDSLLGTERQRLTLRILDETDIAVIVEAPGLKMRTADVIDSAGIPVIRYGRGESVDSLLERIRDSVPADGERFLTGRLVKAGDTVLLVMPQDSEAPKGRLILPQVQVLRELLDRGCIPHCCTPATLNQAIEAPGVAPALVITDSQVFPLVEKAIPPTWPLTSFSILLAAAKGDIETFVKGADSIDSLRPGSRVLIAEACTHVPDTEDIGRVKIPALLRKKTSGLEVTVASGNDFPEDLSPYSLIIQCGGCVANSRLIRSRIRKALLAGVPITNYGIAIAKLQGILGRVSLP